MQKINIIGKISCLFGAVLLHWNCTKNI